MNKEIQSTLAVGFGALAFGLGGSYAAVQAEQRTEAQLQTHPQYRSFRGLSDSSGLWNELEKSVSYYPPGQECVDPQLFYCDEYRGIPAVYPNGLRAHEIIDQLEQHLIVETQILDQIRRLEQQIPEQSKITSYEGQPIEINGMDTVLEQIRALQGQASQRRIVVENQLPQDVLFWNKFLKGVLPVTNIIGIAGLFALMRPLARAVRYGEVD